MNFIFFVQSLVVALMSICFSYIKLIPIVGSCFRFFSTHAIVLPTTGLIGGPLITVIYLAIKFIFNGIFLHKALLYQLCNNLGGIAANISWENNKIINLSILALCFVLFISHPVGFQVPLYTLYWLIPTLLIIANQQSLFYKSFTATWISHAVGSVVWLYIHKIQIKELIFLTLNPLVISERLLFALGIIVCYHAFILIKSAILILCKKYFAQKFKVLA